MQVETLVMWLDIVFKLGILTVAILALIMWSRYMNMKMKETKSGLTGINRSIHSDTFYDKSAKNPQLVFDSILRKENTSANDEETEDISEEEFYKVLNHK
ncbi:hypothetical protein HQ585_18350 [candidate division KSB1 bacterium]|nr:hypothetical protein [candidate division KSB1 bacterium]